MSIATYADLKTAIAARANRTDLTAFIPDFITLATTRIFYGSMEAPLQSDPLRIRAMESSDDLTISGRTAAIPSRVVQARRIYLNTTPPSTVEVISPDEGWGNPIYNSASGRPAGFWMEGENYTFGPIPDTTYTGKLLSYKTFAALSADGDTNWLLTNAPGAYLYGAMIEVWAHLFDADEQQKAHRQFCGVINALNYADKRDRFSGSPWVGRSDTGNP